MSGAKASGWQVGSAASATGLGVVMATRPKLGLTALALVLTLVLKSPVGRLSWMLAGAFLVFQSSSGLSQPKVIYLVGLAGCGSVAAVRAVRHVRTSWGRQLRPVALGALVLVVWLVAELVFAVVAGAPVSQVARDGATYALIVLGLLVGFDAASTVSPGHARMITAGSGVAAAVGFSLAWLARRGVSTVGVDQFMLASMAATAPAVALGLVRGSRGRRAQRMWLILPAVILVLVLASGTRTGVVLFAVVAGVIGPAQRGLIPFRRLAIVAFILAGAVLVSLPLLVSRVATAGFGEQRLTAVVGTLSGGIGQDRSGVIRARAYEYAEQIWLAHPLFGQGLGKVFPNPNPGGGMSDFALDTPLVLLAKFGVIGAALLLVGLALVFASLVQSRPRTDGAGAVARGVLAVSLLTLPFGVPTEDKGFALSMALLVMLAGSELRAHERQSPPSPSGAAADTSPPIMEHGAAGRLPSALGRPRVSRS